MRVPRPAVVLPLLLSSLAAAQVRPVPVETGRPPLAVPGAASPLSFGSPLSAPAALSLTGAPSFSPAPSAALNAVPAAAPIAAPAAVPVAAAPAAVLIAVPAAANAAPTAPAAQRTVAAERTGAHIRSLDAGPVADEGRTERLDSLFDGRAAINSLAAPSEGPEHGPADPARNRALTPGVLKRARLIHRARRIALPLAGAAAVALGAAAPHVAMAAVHVLGQAAYWLANPLAFFFTMPQIHRILSRRSAEVSTSMTAIGLLSALVTTLCFAFDGKDLMMYRNLAQTLGFAAMLGLEFRYSRASGAKLPSKTRALVETAGIALAFTAAAALAGPLLLTVVPATAVIGHLLVTFQVLSGFGFTYMMYAQLRKMNAEQSAGDSSSGMMWSYLGTKVIWLWSLATMLSLVSAPAWMTLGAGALFAGAAWLITRAVLGRLLRAPWSFLPEKISFRGRTLTRRAMGDAGAFVVLSALIMGLSAAGHFAFVSFLGVPAASASLFAMYLLYTVQNLVACVATLKTLRLHKRFAHAGLH